MPTVAVPAAGVLTGFLFRTLFGIWTTYTGYTTSFFTDKVDYNGGDYCEQYKYE